MHVTQSKNTRKLVETSSEVTHSNMAKTVMEVPSIINNERDIKSTGVSFDDTWKSRGWQAKKRLIAVIAQKTGETKNNLP